MSNVQSPIRNVLHVAKRKLNFDIHVEVIFFQQIYCWRRHKASKHSKPVKPIGTHVYREHIWLSMSLIL